MSGACTEDRKEEDRKLFVKAMKDLGIALSRSTCSIRDLSICILHFHYISILGGGIGGPSPIPYIFEGLKTNKSVNSIYLGIFVKLFEFKIKGGNEFDDEGAKLIGEGIKFHKSLKTFSFRIFCFP